MGAQTVCANITSTGTIVAQTINVQQVTSSIVYSSGSNVFGNLLTDVQQFTGSMRITGSLNTIGNACVTSICSPAFVGGTISGTTVYASTVVCSPSVLSSGTICSTGNTCFGGATIIAGDLTIGSVSAGNAGTINVSVGCAGTTAGGLQLWAATNQTHYLQFGDGTAGAGPYAGYVGYAHATDTLSLGTATATRAIITSTGIACFSNTVCVQRLQVFNTNSIIVVEGTATCGEGTVTVAGKNSSGTSRSAIFKYDNEDIIRLSTASNIAMRFETNDTTRFCLLANGVAYFTCDLTAKSLGTNDLILNNLNYECANRIDGTRGSWLIQEGACDLFIINQVSCKKYKFNLIEIK